MVPYKYPSIESETNDGSVLRLSRVRVYNCIIKHVLYVILKKIKLLIADIYLARLRQVASWIRWARWIGCKELSLYIARETTDYLQLFIERKTGYYC